METVEKTNTNLGYTLDHVADLGVNSANEGTLSSVARPVSNAESLTVLCDLDWNMLEILDNSSSWASYLDDTAIGINFD